MLRTVLGMLGAALLASAAPAADERVAVSVDMGHPGATIDRHIFGQFSEHLGAGIYGGIWVGPGSAIPNTRGIRNDVVQALRAIRVPVVRWPGGCFADEYHWHDGVGPKRQAGLNPNWGGVLEPNTFGTHEFMDFADQIGADAYISINVGSGTVKEAADWLQYMTTDKPTALEQERVANGHPAPFKVAYLGLGNEAWGCGGLMSPQEYADKARLFAHFVHNFNPAVTMQDVAVGPDAGKTEYTETVMKSWAENKGWAFDLQGLSLHDYSVAGWPPHLPSTGFGEADYVALLKDALHMEDLIRTHSAIMDKYDPDKHVALVVDEWGAWLAPLPGSNPAFLAQQNSQRDAILAALTLDIFARHADRVRMANIAQMVNVLQAMILTDGPKMVLTPTYHVFHMYLPFQDATLLPVRFDAGTYGAGGATLPRVDAIAARGKDGRVSVALVNVDPHQPASFSIEVPGVVSTRATGETLNAPAIDAVNSFDHPDTVAPRPVTAAMRDGHLSITLAPASITVVTLGA